MLSWAISEAIFFLCPGLVTPMAVRSCHTRVVPSGLLCCLSDPPPLSHGATYLWCHAADGWHVVAGLQKVGGVALQLEFTQPVMNGLSILRRGGRGVEVNKAERARTRPSAPASPRGLA